MFGLPEMAARFVGEVLQVRPEKTEGVEVMPDP